jgi:glucose/arabinose dehydrogenase
MRRLALFMGLAFMVSTALAQTLPTGFFMSDVSSGSTWSAPVGTAFTPDGQRLFVWEKNGAVYVCNRQANGNYAKQATPVLNISDEVGGWRDFGLIGFALDPQFSSNGNIYLLYVVDRHHLLTGGLASNGYNATTNEYFNATIGRVTRYTTTTTSGNLVAVASSRKVLLGESKSTGIPILHESHGVGSLAFAADGTLLITCGDGASYNIEDGGSISHTYYSQAITDGIIRPEENVGAFRSQMLNSHNGKLLRISPETGDGIPSNPFYNPSAPRSAKSRVYALGLRNPFRMSVKPGTGSTNPATGDIGEVFIGEVGWNTWEEQNVCKVPGANFGWPLYEGQTEQPGYMAMNIQNLDEPNIFGTCSGRNFFLFKELIRQDNGAGNKSVFNPCNGSQLIGTNNRYIHARPALDWRHGQDIARVPKYDGSGVATAPTIGTAESNTVGTPFRGNCSAGGIWYTGAGNSFPAGYKNTFIAADYGGTWIRRFTIDFTDVVTRVDNFVSSAGAVVCVTENPLDGSVVVVDIGANTVKKITYGGNQPPVARLTSNVTYGSSPLTVNFTGNTSFDPSPGGSITSYSWNFGGGSPATSTSANPTGVVFTDASGNPKKFVVKLTVTDNSGATHTDSIIISVNNTPPVVNITSPVKNSTYTVGGDVVYPCSATVTDQQHSGSQLKYEWQTILRHNNHEHPEAIDNNVSTSTTISRIGCNGDTYYWMVRLKVTDAAGLSATDSSKIFPNCNTDNVPPLVTTVSPVNAATNVAVNTAITANFNEAIDGSTVTGTTFQLKDPGNNVISAGLSTSSSQATLTPSAPLANATSYTVTLKGGPSGIKDLAGNALANDYNWSFTTVAGGGGGTAYSLFTTTATPTEPTNNDGQGIVVGMKIRSTQSGFITGVRYYKGAGTTGTHTGHLWNGSGTLLGSTTFAGETASGWQQTTFTTPIAINANTTYVVSLFSPSGHYAATDPYFTSAVVNGPLRALADGEDGPNGLYRYSSTSVFPNSSFNSSNYWVDVVFSTGGGAQAVVVTTQPSSQSRCAGANASFSSAATGSPAPTVQWQGSSNGTTWTNIAGATNSTLSFATTIADNNKQYRAVWTNSSGSVNSNAAVLTVNAIPSTPVVSVTNNCGNSILAATGTTGALLWSNGATTSSITVTAGGTYSVTQTINGCVSSPGSGIAAPLSSSVPAPTVTVTNNCGNSVLTATGTTGTLLWSNNATTSSITVTTAGTYSVTQTINGCVSPSASGVAAPKATPVLSGNLAATATSGITFTYTASSSTSGTSFSWSRAVVTGISNSAASGTGNIIETLVNTTASAVNVTYVYTLTANGCTNTQNLVVTVNPVGSQQPVTIQSLNSKTGTSATVHSLTAVPAGALLVLATTADAVVSNSIVSSTPALTWTKRADAGATNSDNAEIWTAVYSAGGTISVTSNWGDDNSQSSVCYVVLNAEPSVGGAFATAVLQAAPSVTITTTRANSIIFGCTADWKAIDGTTRTLRDAATERLYFKDGNFTTYHYTKAAGSIATYTEGVSLPTGQQASTALLEIRGGAVATRPVNSAITGINNSNSNVDSYSLGQNYPNPFDKRTNIPFTLFGAEQVNMVLFDINGRIVKVLVNGSRDAGKHFVNFNAGSLAKGVYYYRIQAGDFIDVKKLTIW